MNRSLIRGPDTVLLATLNTVGTQITLIDDDQFVGIFDSAANDYPELYGRFRSHPQYKVSDVLSEALQSLDQAGSIVRHNAAQMQFRVSRHAAGQFGKSILASFSPNEKKAIGEVAKRLADTYKSSHDDSK